MTTFLVSSTIVINNQVRAVQTGLPGNKQIRTYPDTQNEHSNSNSPLGLIR